MVFEVDEGRTDGWSTNALPSGMCFGLGLRESKKKVRQVGRFDQHLSRAHDHHAIERVGQQNARTSQEGVWSKKEEKMPMREMDDQKLSRM